MPANHTEVEKRLWEAADELRANSKLKSSEYSVPVLGLIFLRYADQKFAEAEKKLAKAGSGRRKIGKTDYQAKGVLFIPEKARFATLLNLAEGTDIGKAINEAMKAIEAENEDLKDVLPKTYNALEKGLLVSLLKNFSAIPITEGIGMISTVKSIETLHRLAQSLKMRKASGRRLQSTSKRF
jgi:type I restriction enzyme M protein